MKINSCARWFLSYEATKTGNAHRRSESGGVCASVWHVLTLILAGAEGDQRIDVDLHTQSVRQHTCTEFVSSLSTPKVANTEQHCAGQAGRYGLVFSYLGSDELAQEVVDAGCDHRHALCGGLCVTARHTEAAQALGEVASVQLRRDSEEGAVR